MDHFPSGAPTSSTLPVEKGIDMQDHRKLKVWNRAHDVGVDVYRFTADFPVEERYGMTA